MKITPVVGAAVAVAFVAGCGVAERAEPAAKAARAFSHAVGDGDLTAACALLAPRAAERLTATGAPCADELGALALPAGAVRGTEVWGERAQVRTSVDTLFLVELDDGWRIAAAGCAPAEEDSYRCRLEST